MKNNKQDQQKEEQFNLETALSVDGIDVMQINLDQLKTHNDGLQTQNGELQEDLYTVRKALELVLTDTWVAMLGKEPSDADLKKEVDDYLKQAKEALKG